jgi:cytidylate kinase
MQRIERYLRAQQASIAALEEREIRARPHPFVTISRQAGAGGHTLADALLDVFSRQDDTALFAEWQVFDQKLCEIVASDPMFSHSMDSLVTEEYRTTINDFFHQVLRSTVEQDIVMSRVFRVVRSLASIGKAIIVGRAGSQVTKGMELGVRLRIVAPLDVRIQRMMERSGLNERRARDEVRRLDAHRARLLKNHFRVDIDDPTGYDAVWNTSGVSVEEIAEAVAAILRRRVATRQPS